jgi:hypothetical protein
VAGRTTVNIHYDLPPQASTSADFAAGAAWPRLLRSLRSQRFGARLRCALCRVLRTALFNHALLLEVWRLHIWMGQFGAPSAKGTHLFSNRKWVEQIKKDAVPMRRAVAGGSGAALVRRYIDKAGRARCSGTGLLKRSQQGA